jgi:hypothetical protein
MQSGVSFPTLQKNTMNLSPGSTLNLIPARFLLGLLFSPEGYYFYSYYFNFTQPLTEMSTRSKNIMFLGNRAW